MTLRTPLFIATLAGALTLSAVSYGQAPDDPRKAQADALFQEGVRLHAQDREAEALDRFRRAYALYPSPAALVSIGREEQLLGEPLEAIRHYREALKNPLLNPTYAGLAKQYIAELEMSVSRQCDGMLVTQTDGGLAS